jgi:hypothetical protein
MARRQFFGREKKRMCGCEAIPTTDKDNITVESIAKAFSVVVNARA